MPMRRMTWTTRDHGRRHGEHPLVLVPSEVRVHCSGACLRVWLVLALVVLERAGLFCCAKRAVGGGLVCAVAARRVRERWSTDDEEEEEESDDGTEDEVCN